MQALVEPEGPEGAGAEVHHKIPLATEALVVRRVVLEERRQPQTQQHIGLRRVFDILVVVEAEALRL